MWALFAGLGLMMVGNGLNGAVIGIRSGTEGFSVVVTGVVMAAYFAGFLLAPSIVVKLIPSVGHIRVFAGLASTASSAVLMHAVSVLPLSWAIMRFIFGFCMAGLYIVIESWLGAMSDASNRGRTLAIYMIVSMGGLGAGQYLVALADPSGFRLFVVASVLVSMSLVPITLAATTRAPQVLLPEGVSVRELIRTVPTGVLGSLMSGAAAGMVFGLGAVYATAIGLSLERTGFFLVAPTIGAIIFQWPIGRLSDLVSRRSVIFGVALVASGVCGALLVVAEQSILVPMLMIALGGTMFPLYSLVISYTLDWTPEAKTMGASATLVRINGTGALIGPLVGASLMSAFGPQWFFWSLGSVFMVLVVYLAWRLLAKSALPMERQGAFVPFPSRAGALAFGLITAPMRQVTKLAAGRHVTSRRHPHLDGVDHERHPTAFTRAVIDSANDADPHDMPPESPITGP
ncbi:MFS transporter [Ilumatobacter coccineus]|uniref:Putative major facilitator superfamily transporter n=1 Tax=Ilumatobacter coccineus (strain NBRC 103263 / KCTC 29153 / YM16-304) TaxID=1313172 RepID=A0A6C7EB54_ILUCY|nr:MFS transporter [Ilumatobacter coccineus]BAN03977.1 putative major facilitator superfamily transporter [Ilumatobacter coccineus YM16-304]